MSKSKALNNLLDRLRYPATARSTQDAYDRLRIADVEAAKLTRPEFIQIQNTLPGTSATLPVSVTSESLDYPVIITGAITDAEDKEGSFFRKRTEDAFVQVGDQADVRLSIDAIAGKSVAAAGLAGIQDFISPFMLEEKGTISLEIYDGAVADLTTTVFKGVRVLTPQQSDGQLTAEERKQVMDCIAKYSSPQPRFLTVPIAFSSHVALGETPKQDEPLLIHGFRSTFTDALINFGLTKADSFSREQFAIWALCSEPNNARMLYQPLKFPLFVPAKRKAYFSLTDTIDGTTFATDGQIEVFATTP